MTTWNKSNRPSSTLPIRYAPITEAFPYTKLQAALLQANVEPLYTGDVEAFKARRLKEEKRKLATTSTRRPEKYLLARAMFWAGAGVASAFGAALIFHPPFAGWAPGLLGFFIAFVLSKAARYPGLLSGSQAHKYNMLEWRTYQLGECANGWANMVFEVKGAGLTTATVIPDEIKHRMCLIAGTGVRANFSLEQLDVDPFVWVSDKDERYCIGQFDEQGFVR